MSLRAGGGMFYYSRLPGLFLNDAAISAPFSLRIDLWIQLPALRRSDRSRILR